MYCLYGIPNCSTVKKARVALEELGIEFKFRDIRKEDLSRKEWEALAKQDAEGKLINTKSPSFRKLEVDKESLTSIKAKSDVLVQSPTAMKRPVLTKNDKIISIGYKDGDFESL